MVAAAQGGHPLSGGPFSLPGLARVPEKAADGLPEPGIGARAGKPCRFEAGHLDQ